MKRCFLKARSGALTSIFGLITFLSIFSAPQLDAQIIISEFMASNRDHSLDEEGGSPDWIEIFNAGPEVVDMDGWHLTDNNQVLNKWTFPQIEIPSRGFLKVWCSGKHQIDPSAPLHTNFKLQRTGEYLALVRPDGATVEWQFTPRYPHQISDVSYGYPQPSESRMLLGINVPAKALVPENDDLGMDWIQPDFNDEGWIEGTTAIGFDVKSRPTYTDLIKTDISEVMRRTNATCYQRIAFNVDNIDGFDLLHLNINYEDGFVAYLNGEEAARDNSPTSPNWNSRSSGRQTSTEGNTTRTFDITHVKHLLRAGRNVLAIHAMNDSPSSSDFFVLPQLAGVTVGDLDTTRRQYFEEPSPGQPNQIGFDAVAPQPDFSVESGAFTGEVVVSLTTEAQGGVIRFTTDGTIPNADSDAYEGPLTIDRTTVVKARVYLLDHLPSEPVSHTYISIHARVENFSSNLPIITVNTLGNGIPGSGSSTYGEMHLAVFDLDPDTQRASFKDTPAYQGKGGIRVRGSSSAGFAKQNFAVETWDVDNEDLAVSLLDMPEDSDWILHGPYSDKTLMRNALTYQWSNAVGQYAVRTRFVELYINQAANGQLGQSTNDYRGIYVFMEKIKIQPGRVDIDDMLASDNNEPEISGGYILKNDRLDPGDAGIRTARGQPLALYAPKEDDISPQQRSWIINWLNQYETALYGGNFANPELGYRKFIDTTSFIDHHLIVELCKNIDGYRLSTFMYKKRGGKMFMGPVWDYNLSLGNADYNAGWQTSGWYYTHTGGNGYPWYPRLFQDKGFDTEYRQRWSALREGPLATDVLQKSIDDYVELLEEAVPRNFTRWRILGVELWPNWFVGKTYAEEITFMKNWLDGRLAWMDSQLTVPPELIPAGGDVEKGSVVTMNLASGEIYYTLDGSDPRGSNSRPSETAILYSEDTPVVIEENTLIRARALVGGNTWSDIVEGIYVTEIPKLMLTEIMYNPEGGIDFEFLEITNYGDTPIDLSQSGFERGVIFDFEDSEVQSIDPGEYIVLVRDLETFSSRYDTNNFRVAGEYRGSLSDRSESITFNGNVGEQIFEVRYSDQWQPTTDGGGYSLVLKDINGNPEEWPTEAGWTVSSEVNGSPGFRDGDKGPQGWQITGDSNQDGKFNISDAIHLIRYLFAGEGITLPCADGSPNNAANLLLLNTNSDFVIDSSDVVYNLRYLFLEGPAPALGFECRIIQGCPDACTGE